MAPARRNAFTLIELLIAMTIVAVVALTLAACLHIGFSARDASERSMEMGRSAEVAMEFLRSDLQNALPPRGTFAGLFTGSDAQDDRGNDADDLVFYSTSPAPQHAQGANGELKQIELTSYQPQNSTDHILVRRTLNNLLAPVPETPDEEVLCRHVHGFNLRYYDGTQWQDSWTSSQYNYSLPVAVEVTLALEASDKNKDGSPRIVTYTHIFQLPCAGQAVAN